MTSHRCLEFLLYILLCCTSCSTDTGEPESMFRAVGSMIEMGYCFGVDYIVVYRSLPEEDQLLGNSSDNNAAIKPPADMVNRIRHNQHQHLLGLQIMNLTHMDSGIYRRECWKNHTLVSQLIQYLSVCNEEVESEEIIVMEEAAGTRLLCNSTFSGLEGTSVRWYYESYPIYKVTLFLDTSVSLKPLVEELQGIVDVRDSGASLVLDNSVFKNLQHFHCLVMKDNNCLSFQNMYLPDRTENTDIFVSQGDRVALKCPSDGNDQQWETPLGKMNRSSTRIGQMYLSFGDDSKDFSLIIPAVTDELSGEYLCISSSLELQYLLVLCPKKNPQEKFEFEGANFSLECKVSRNDSQRVQWYRMETAGEYKLIYASNDNTADHLEHLKGRVTLPDNGSSLMISGAEMEDAGVYWCIVLGSSEFLENDFDYDYEEEETEDEAAGDQYWQSTDRCIFKQETVLTIIKAETFETKNRNPGSIPTEEPDSGASNIAIYAGVGVAVLLLVAAIAIVIAVKKKRARTSHSGPHSNNKAINMREDPGCTKGLTSEDCDA
ncbi:Ig lambda chain V-V region DEL [Solea senegalensis]|uniref:Ig lambda chain V-V region DEL n=1 Tax=Solea senegalensis TaxID=28829 RepID=A0AAV6SX50_SOLSE|nr:Ig lambda chain V-V region DEL [Solea senegalensis]